MSALHEFVAALRPIVCDVTLTGAGRFSANLTRATLDRLTIVYGEDNVARIARVMLPAGYTAFTFLPGFASQVFVNGLEHSRYMIIQHTDGEEYTHRTVGPSVWGGMILPTCEVASLLGQFGGSVLPGEHMRVAVPTAHALRRLLRVYTRAIRLIQSGSAVLQTPETARGLELALLAALAGCLADPGAFLTERGAMRQHAQIMDRFSRLLHADPERLFLMADICSATGVSARTLRTCCQEHLGMGPKHFLMVRNMNLVRRALLAADCDQATVTDLATKFGFWELGRFAGRYRELFGESPSCTLRRGTPAPGPAQHRKVRPARSTATRETRRHSHSGGSSSRGPEASSGRATITITS